MPDPRAAMCCSDSQLSNRPHMPHGERFWLGLLGLGRGGDEVMAEAEKRGLCLG